MHSSNKKYEFNSRERPKHFLPSTPKSPNELDSDQSTPVSVTVLKERFQQASTEKSKLDTIKAERKAELTRVVELRETGILPPKVNNSQGTNDQSSCAPPNRIKRLGVDYNAAVDRALGDLGFLAHDPTAPPISTLPPRTPIIKCADQPIGNKRSKLEFSQTETGTSTNPSSSQENFLEMLAVKNLTKTDVHKLESRKRKSNQMSHPPDDENNSSARSIDYEGGGDLSPGLNPAQYSGGTSSSSREASVLSESLAANRYSEGISKSSLCSYSDDVDSSYCEELVCEDDRRVDESDDMTEVTSAELSESCIKRKHFDPNPEPIKSNQSSFSHSSRLSVEENVSIADTNEYYPPEEVSFTDTQNTSEDCNREELDSLLEDAFDKVLPKDPIPEPIISAPKLALSPQVTPNTRRGRHRRSLSADFHISSIGSEHKDSPPHSVFVTSCHGSPTSTPLKLDNTLAAHTDSGMCNSTPLPPQLSATAPGASSDHSDLRSRLTTLHTQLNREEAIISQTSKALVQCKKKSDRFMPGSAEHVESCRLLLIACQKRQALIEEIQRLNHIGLIQRGLSGSLILSGIKLVLKPGYIQSKNSLQSLYGVVGATEQHHIMILIRCPGQGRLINTEMVTIVPSRDSRLNSPTVSSASTPESSSGKSSSNFRFVEIPNCFSINNLPPGFRTSIEVYAMSIYNSCVSTPGPHGKSMCSSKHVSTTSLLSNNSTVSSSSSRNHISSLFSVKTPNITSGRKFKNLFRLPSSASKSGHHVNSEMSTPSRTRSSYFSLIASEELTISTLTKSTCLKFARIPNSFPLEGSVHFQASLNMENNLQLSGFMSKFEEVGGFGNWSRAWWHLQGDKLVAWRYPEQVPSPSASGDNHSIYCVDLLTVIDEKVELAPEEVCARPALYLTVIRKARHSQEGGSLVTERCGHWIREKVLLSAESREERQTWQEKINTTLLALQEWMPDHFVQLRITSKLFP